MQHLLLIGAIFILMVILFIVIFLIIREILQRSHHRQRHRRHVGFRVIRNQAEFEEFRRGLYVPRLPVVRTAPDSGIDDVDTSASSGEVYHWSASSAGSSTVTPPSRSVSLDVSRRFKAVSFADSMDFSQIDYDDHSSGRIPTISGVSSTSHNTEPKLTAYSTGGRRFTQHQSPLEKPIQPRTPQKMKNVKRSKPSAHEQECVMREFQVIDEKEEESDLCFEPMTSL